MYVISRGKKRKEKEVCLEPDTLSWAPHTRAQFPAGQVTPASGVSVTAAISWDARVQGQGWGFLSLKVKVQNKEKDNRIKLWGFSCRSK